MIKLLAVDMDGTCLNSEGKMSEETFSALKKAAEAGITVVPTTGRNLSCIPERIKDEVFYNYVITTNGALAIDLRAQKELFSAFLDNEAATELLRKIRKYPILTAVNINRRFYIKGLLLYYGVRRVLGSDARNMKIVISAVKAAKNKTSRIEGIHLFYANEKYRDIIKKLVSQHDDICVTFSRKYAEVYSSYGTKGNALLALGKYLGIKPEEIACFGDEANDVSMFKVAGMSFAMGNAIDELKKIADVILPTNDDNGVAFAINNYILSANNTQAGTSTDYGKK